jgi:dihydrofolate reductase
MAGALEDQGAGGVVFEQARSMDALLLGRRTYEFFAAYWPKASEEIPFTGLLNGVPKYVASRTLAGPLAWQGSTLVTGLPRRRYRRRCDCGAAATLRIGVLRAGKPRR